jgi:hypothetical protein
MAPTISKQDPSLSPGKRLHHQRSSTGLLVDTRWCHYQTLQVLVAPSQKGEKPPRVNIESTGTTEIGHVMKMAHTNLSAPGDENDREKGRNATPHLREAPEQQQQVEHEDAMGDVEEDGERVGAGFEIRMATKYAPLNSHI